MENWNWSIHSIKDAFSVGVSLVFIIFGVLWVSLIVVASFVLPILIILTLLAVFQYGPIYDWIA